MIESSQTSKQASVLPLRPGGGGAERALEQRTPLDSHVTKPDFQASSFLETSCPSRSHIDFDHLLCFMKLNSVKIDE